MTPLAARLLKLSLLPKKQRDPDVIWWEDQNVALLREALNDVHCFECSGCLPLVEMVSEMLNKEPDHGDKRFGPLVFLPAPKTWIEWKYAWAPQRIGMLIEQASLDWSRVTVFTESLASEVGVISNTEMTYTRKKGQLMMPTWLRAKLRLISTDDQAPLNHVLSMAHVCLLLINSPKVIGRKQYMPHGGLERRLLKSMGVGKFPLHAWTEIRLQVAKPPEIDDGKPHEAHLTGQRALHFVRKHIRIRRGQLEYVSAHWRGDPAIGIKRSRYVVGP